MIPCLMRPVLPCLPYLTQSDGAHASDGSLGGAVLSHLRQSVDVHAPDGSDAGPDLAHLMHLHGAHAANGPVAAPSHDMVIRVYA